MYHRIGGVPTPGDTVEVDGLRLKVETTDGRRVGKVLVTRRTEGTLEGDEDAAPGTLRSEKDLRSAKAKAAGTRAKR
jgi:hypothetical protein